MNSIMAADLFCGAGGTSTGMVSKLLQLGYKIEDIELVAVNHSTIAIATHSANHPWARHLCENLDNVSPKAVVPGGYLDIMVASPECTHHSRARGGKPISDQSRASAWHVLRWAGALYIENILIENVPEFQTWGPLDKEGYPIESLKGQTYLGFLDALRSLGYSVDARVLNCADFGDPTTRKRLFILARRSKPVVWPEPSHAKIGSKDLFGERKAWRPAREVIDWSIESESIFTRKRALSPNTMRRIMKGLQKFSGLPFVIGQQSCAAPRETGEPLPTVAGAGAIALIQPQMLEPFVLPQEGIYRNNAPRSIDEPLPTITANRGAGGLVQPYLVKMYGTNHAGSLDEPVPTVTAQGNHLYLAEPFIVACNHGEDDSRSHSVDEPMPTVTSVDAWGVIEPFLIQMDMGGTLHSIEEPINTITSAEARALVQPYLVKYHGENRPGGERVGSVDDPMPTVACSNQYALAEPFIVSYYSNGKPQSVDEPLNTVTSKDRFGIVLPLVDGRSVVVDIKFRMLQPHELAAAMSFPADYQFLGNREQKVKQIGNAVPGKTAEALIGALLG